MIRHGDTSYTQDDKAHGWSQEKLTPKGKEEIENMTLANKPDFLVASDLPRTVQTAQIIGKQHDIPVVEKSEALRTWDIGHYQGMPCSKADPILKDFVNNPDTPIPGGESFNQFKTRVLGGVEDILTKYPSGNIGMVAHSKVQKLLDATEAGNWQHVDANHFNEEPDTPGKEKTMTLGGYEGMRPSTNVEDYRNESTMHKMGEQLRLQAVRFIHDPMKFILHGGNSVDVPQHMMDESNDEGVGTEGQIKNFKYGIPSAGAGRARYSNDNILKDVTDTAPLSGRDGHMDVEDIPMISKNEKLFEFNDKGQKGHVIIEPQDDGKHLHVRWIGGSHWEEGTNELGPSSVRNILGEIKQRFPDAETLGGSRASGARMYGRPTADWKDVDIKLK